ncbi:MAG TPA: M90 family metallopeptidase [Capsulimonadaceae bacterium]|jgi:hypothetical protein
MKLPWPFRSRLADAASQPFPDAWTGFLDANVKLYALLTPAEQARLRDDLRVFMGDKYWEGALGFEITDEVKVTVSALACLLTVGFEQHDSFPNVETILVYPTAYQMPNVPVHLRRGVTVLDPTSNDTDPRLGEAHGIGPVVLSWEDVVAGGQSLTDGHNLVFHEFAHKLDFRDGYSDGVPYLRKRSDVDRWAAVMSAAFEMLVEDVTHHRHTILQPYGATNAAEFFAVCTECYYEKPVAMREKMPDLYDVLRGYYGIDWAERMGG